MKLTKCVIIVLTAINFLSCNETKNQTEADNTTLKVVEPKQTSADIARGFYQEVIVNKDMSKYDKYIGDTYVQHATGYPDGVEPLREELAGNAKEHYNLVNILRVVGEGDYAALHSLWEYKNNKMVYVDIWRIENGKLVEHWDHFQKVPEKAENDNTIYLGPDTNINANQNIEQNKKRALAVLKTFDNLDDLSAVENYVADGYIQHNPTVADGKEAFLGLFKFLKGINYKSKTEIAKTIAMGDMVIVHSKVTELSKKDDLGTGAIDIFRFDNNGKIIEHWDVLEPLTGKSLNTNDPFEYKN